MLPFLVSRRWVVSVVLVPVEDTDIPSLKVFFDPLVVASLGFVAPVLF